MTCAELGFEPTDRCQKWTAKTLGDGRASVEDSTCVVRVKEPTLAEILEHPEIRDPWVEFRARLENSEGPCFYSEADGGYYFGFSNETEANRFAAGLQKEPYVQLKHGFVMPLRSMAVPDGVVQVGGKRESTAE